MRTLKTWAAAVGLTVSVATTAQAALVSLGDGTVKDTNTNRIWLQDWNRNGLGNWSTQMAWADNLTFAGSSDWLLPSIDEYDALSTAYGNLRQVSDFTNVQLGNYWSGTEIITGGFAWVIFPANGLQLGDVEDRQLYAVAVRPATVPEPQTLALALMALGATMVARRRRQA